MIYDYLDKWLTERWRVMETPLSYEIHRTHHVDFSGHLNLSAAPPPPPPPNLLPTHHLLGLANLISDGFIRY